MPFRPLRVLLPTLAALGAFAFAAPLASAQGLPGQTIGETCPTVYKRLSEGSYATGRLMTSYRSCTDGHTVKFVEYYLPNSDESFGYLEWRDRDGDLYGSRFNHYPAGSDRPVILADSDLP